MFWHNDAHSIIVQTFVTTLNHGCGVIVEAGVGVGGSRPFRLEPESELESVKFCRFRLRPGVVGYQPSTGNDFGGTVTRRPENIEGQEERRVTVRR